ncbi:MAG TPA: hypothetical protein VF168_12375 [Trueperaceae bacterium]
MPEPAFPTTLRMRRRERLLITQLLHDFPAYWGHSFAIKRWAIYELGYSDAERRPEQRAQ